ncbi:COR domain-containing protein [Luteolibacter sp.]|uniref:COR domain-containing protein n=1 Tax=Luteolibacter sp. TaxID=1962973 RepID=UPI0032672D07
MNELDVLPDEISNLDNLRALDCFNSHVGDLTPLSGLKSMQWLNCSWTRIDDLSSLSGLTSLESLDCSGTRIRDLSPLKNLINLRMLRCGKTLVTDLGPLKSLVNLWSLNLLRCRITNLPLELLNSPALERLEFIGVHLVGTPPELFQTENCLEALRSHFRDLEAGEELLPDVKVIVLGNGRIGKTQLCGQLKGEAFKADAESTHGITVSSTELGNDRLHLWDFGGQDLYHGTHALFMRTRAVFVILWTPDSENLHEDEWQGMTFRNHQLDYWLQMMKHLGGKENPLLIVQCRCDTPEDELGHPPLQAGLLGKFPYHKLLHHSSATPRGLSALREALTDAVKWMRSKQGEVKIGAGRLRVKRRLETLREVDASRPVGERQHRLVSQEFFQGICKNEGGVSDPSALLSYLHECGVIFHRPGLFGDQIILDQGWALEAIYTVFHRTQCWRQLRCLNGRFTRALLEALVWQGHSRDEQLLFLSMMESCGICFVLRELEDGEKEYIAPDLLPPMEDVTDELTARWGEEGPDQSHIYDFPYEHPGLVTAVISKVGAMAGIDALYWKGGFCGYEKNSRSRVRIRQISTGYSGKEMHIKVETKGGDAKALIREISKSVEQAAYHAGCRQWGREQENEDLLRVMKGLPMRNSREPDEDQDKETSLEFIQEPRDGRTYAVSYAWTDESTKFVDELCERAEKDGVTVLRDKTALGLGERLTQFMQRLAEQDRVFVILSKKYLESPYCMFELLEVWRQSKMDGREFLKRVRCFALPDAEFSNETQRFDRALYWDNKFNELDARVRTRPKLVTEEDFRRYKRMLDFAHRVGDILSVMADTLQPRTLDDLMKHGFYGSPPE